MSSLINNSNSVQPITEFNPAVAPQCTLLPTSGMSVNDRRFHLTSKEHYYYDTGFSGPSAAFYRVGRGVYDTFDRTDSTTYPGTPEFSNGSWNMTAGTWGINSNRLKCITDANFDAVLLDSELADLTLQTVVSGELNSGVTFRGQALVFRGLDANTLLRAVLINGLVRLDKRDGGGAAATLSSVAQTTTNGVDYTLTVVCQGLSVLIYVNGTLKINYSLVAAEYKYLAYTQVGFQLYKGGAPATDAFAQSLVVRQKANIT